MQNLKRYSQMWISMAVIVLAGYVGTCAGLVVTWSAGPCNAYYLNGTLAGYVSNGCCYDESSEYDAVAFPCPSGKSTCQTTYYNNSRSITCI